MADDRDLSRLRPVACLTEDTSVKLSVRFIGVVAVAALVTGIAVAIRSSDTPVARQRTTSEAGGTPAEPRAGRADQPALAAAISTRHSAGPPVVPRKVTGVDLTDPRKKDLAMRLVSSAENSTLDWRSQYSYIEDIGDGRGYTAGIIGFCTGTSDLLALVEAYTRRKPGNVLARYLPALRAVDGSDSHAGLDPTFTGDWRTAAADPVFRETQNAERDRVYFNPAVAQAKADGLRALGQFVYYDAIVMHGPGSDRWSFGGIRSSALAKAKSPAQGGDEIAYLNAFLDARRTAMRTEEAHSDTSRVDDAQRVFVRNRNLDLETPLVWKVYGDPYKIAN
jgi:chitosanase